MVDTVEALVQRVARQDRHALHVCPDPVAFGVGHVGRLRGQAGDEGGKQRNACVAKYGDLLVSCVGSCKDRPRVLALVREGVNRPGAMEYAVDGLTAKVFNERLKKLTRYGIPDKTVYPESPPRVECRLTDFGRQFSMLLDEIEALERSLE